MAVTDEPEVEHVPEVEPVCSTDPEFLAALDCDYAGDPLLDCPEVDRFGMPRWW